MRKVQAAQQVFYSVTSALWHYDASFSSLIDSLWPYPTTRNFSTLDFNASEKQNERHLSQNTPAQQKKQRVTNLALRPQALLNHAVRRMGQRAAGLRFFLFGDYRVIGVYPTVLFVFDNYFSASRLMMHLRVRDVLSQQQSDALLARAEPKSNKQQALPLARVTTANNDERLYFTWLVCYALYSAFMQDNLRKRKVITDKEKPVAGTLTLGSDFFVMPEGEKLLFEIPQEYFYVALHVLAVVQQQLLIGSDRWQQLSEPKQRQLLSNIDDQHELAKPSGLLAEISETKNSHKLLDRNALSQQSCLSIDADSDEQTPQAKTEPATSVIAGNSASSTPRSDDFSPKKFESSESDVYAEEVVALQDFFKKMVAADDSSKVGSVKIKALNSIDFTLSGSEVSSSVRFSARSAQRERSDDAISIESGELVTHTKQVKIAFNKGQTQSGNLTITLDVKNPDEPKPAKVVVGQRQDYSSSIEAAILIAVRSGWKALAVKAVDDRLPVETQKHLINQQIMALNTISGLKKKGLIHENFARDSDKDVCKAVSKDGRCEALDLEQLKSKLTKLDGSSSVKSSM